MSETWCEQILASGGKVPPGVYDVTKRAEVNEGGTIRWVDMPGGVPVAGFWSNTLTLVEPVADV